MNIKEIEEQIERLSKAVTLANSKGNDSEVLYIAREKVYWQKKRCQHNDGSFEGDPELFCGAGNYQSANRYSVTQSLAELESIRELVAEKEKLEKENNRLKQINENIHANVDSLINDKVELKEEISALKNSLEYEERGLLAVENQQLKEKLKNRQTSIDQHINEKSDLRKELLEIGRKLDITIGLINAK